MSQEINPIPSHRFSEMMGDFWEVQLQYYGNLEVEYDEQGFPQVECDVKRQICRPQFDATNPYTWDRRWRDCEIPLI